MGERVADFEVSGRYGLVVRSLAVLCLLLPSQAGAGELTAYESKHYVLHADVAADEAREASLRLARMAELYRRRTEGFGGKIEGRLPVYLYNDAADYERAGGAKGSAGVFDGEKLVVLAIRRKDGSVANATWRVLQHEGFHQFARAVIGGEIPMWANEGLAEYFGEAVFTGDGYVTGVVPQERLVRVRKMLREGAYPPLKDFLDLSREGWNVAIRGRNYDLAWSLVQFFAHGGGEKYQDGFGVFMEDVSRGGVARDALVRHLGAVAEIEKVWRAYWLGLGDEPTRDRYARATVAMLTSFLARAHLAGRRFDRFEQLVGVPAAELEFGGNLWLPAGLWRDALEEVRVMRGEGARFELVGGEGGLPRIEVAMRGGVRVVGSFVMKEGRVEVEARVVGR